MNNKPTLKQCEDRIDAELNKLAKLPDLAFGKVFPLWKQDITDKVGAHAAGIMSEHLLNRRTQYQALQN